MRPVIVFSLTVLASALCWNPRAIASPWGRSPALDAMRATSAPRQAGQGQKVQSAASQTPPSPQGPPAQPPKPIPATPQVRKVFAFGDLSRVCPNETCPTGLTVVVVGSSESEGSLSGSVLNVVGQTALIQFSGPANFNPSKVMVVDQTNKQGPGTAPSAFLNVQNLADVKQRRVTLRGDFRHAGACASGYLSDANLNSVTISVVNVGDRAATIEYFASNDFVPDTITLFCGANLPITEPFDIFRGLHRSVVGFTSASITEDFCGGACRDLTGADVNLSLQPFDPDADAKLLRVTSGRVWVELTATPEYTPAALSLHIHKTVGDKPLDNLAYAKRLLGPVIDNHLPFLTYTVMDSETEKRDFGRRISNNYLAINVQVHNPTDQKIQLNKARLWFDCDYAEIEFRDLYSNNPMYRHVGESTQAKKFIFGIDHTQRHFPHTLAQLMGAFDAETGFEKTVFDGADLAGAVLSSLTGVFAQLQYAQAVNVFAGVFVPGLRKIVVNTDEINQKRASLVSQALDSILQVSPKGASSTLVFLPRKGILAWQDTDGQDRQIPVLVDLIRDIHFEPEIIVDSATSPDQVVTAGMTEDAVKKILGEPTTRTESNGQLTYTYSSGHYKEVHFKKDGTGVYRSSTFVERPVTERLVVGKATIADAEGWLGASRPDLKDTVDGGKIWFKIPPMSSENLIFGPDNVLKQRNYQDALAVLKALSNPKLSDVKAKAESLALNADTKRKIVAAFAGGGDAGLYRIPSPDLANSTIIIQCKETTKQAECNVQNINYKLSHKYENLTYRSSQAKGDEGRELQNKGFSCANDR